MPHLAYSVYRKVRRSVTGLLNVHASNRLFKEYLASFSWIVMKYLRLGAFEMKLESTIRRRAKVVFIVMITMIKPDPQCGKDNIETCNFARTMAKLVL